MNLCSKKSVRKRKLLVSLLALFLCLGTSPVWAQEEDDTLETFTLDPILVTAQRRETKDLDTAASVMVLSQEQLQETGAANLFDALRLQNGVMSYSYGESGSSWGAMNSKIIIRGNERGTLILIDGVQSSLNDNYFLETLPVEAIERVEVVKGASSVLYGNNSSGGVINIITKEKFNNSLSLSMGEYGRDKQSVSLNLGRFNIIGAFKQSDLKKGLSGNGTAFNDRNMAAGLWKYQITDDLVLMHQHTHTNYKNNRFRLVGGVVNWNDPSQGGRYIYKEDYVRLKYTPDSWKINLFYNRSDRDRIITNLPANTLANSDKVLLDEFGLDVQKEIKSSFADFIVGANFSKESYDLDDRRTPANSYEADRKTMALFMQASKDFGKDLTAIVGFRQEWVHSTNRKNIDSFCPQFQLLNKLDANNSLFINVAKTFKMPNFTALYGGASGLVIPSPNLQPEEGWSYEFGWKKASKSSMLKASVYHLDMDAITYNNIGGNLHPVNSPFRNLGLEITYDKQLSNKYSFSVGANFANPKTKNNGNWERRFARQQYTMKLKYTDDKWTMALSSSITADRVGDLKNMAPTNFHVGYKLNKNSKLELNVENIFNRTDIIGNWTSPTSTLYYSMPRNVSLTYKVFF